MTNPGLPIYVRLIAYIFLGFGAYHEFNGIWFNRVEPMTANMVEMWHDMMGVVNTAFGILILAVHLMAKRLPSAERRGPARARMRTPRRVWQAIRTTPRAKPVLSEPRMEEGA